MIEYRTIDSPIGPLTLAGHGSVLTNLRMVDQTYEPARAGWSPGPGAFAAAVEQLDAYFAGELVHFDIELDLRGTQFQQRVWKALLTIPYARDPVVRANRRTDRCPRFRARRRAGQRPKPHRDRRPVPPRHRRRRQPYRLWRRTRTKANPARIGEAAWRMRQFDVIRLGREIKNTPELPGVFLCMFGGVLLFHPKRAVSSALTGLASGFGMGPGVSLSLWPP